MDTTAVVAIFVGLTAAAAAIGAAKLIPAATSVAFSWVKGMIFG